LEELLRGHFSQDGPIKDLRVLPPKSSHQSRIAFVTFEDSASAQRALSRPGRLFLGSRLNVSLGDDIPRLQSYRRSLQVRQKEHKELGQHFHQRQYGSKTLMTVNGGVSANNEGTPQGEMAGGENMHPTACAVPSMTIRFGSGPASPEVTLGQTNRVSIAVKALAIGTS
jgi:RNA recognition motif-containing protein